MILDDLLNGSKLIVVLGRGGVGKTTVSAALGIRAAAKGMKTIIVTIDPANRLADALNIEGEMKNPTRVNIEDVATPLYGLMLDRKQTCDELVHRFAKNELIRNRILDNPYYRYFSTSLSGGQEYMAIEKVRQLLTSEEYDLVVLDTPPATHAFDFLDAPNRLIGGLKRLPSASENQQNTLFGRLRHKGGQFVFDGLKRLTGGRFLNDLAEFLKLFRHILVALEQSSSVLETELRARHTSFLYIDIEDHQLLNRVQLCQTALSSRKLSLRGLVLNRANPYFDDLDWREAKKRLKIYMKEHTKPDQLETLMIEVNRFQQELNTQTDRFKNALEMQFNAMPTWSVPLKRNWQSNVEALRDLSEGIVSRSP